MNLASMTAVVLYKSLWRIVPLVGSSVITAIIERKEDLKTMLVLTERKTREEIIRFISSFGLATVN